MVHLSSNIELAIRHLEQGRVIGLPTETVYGLAADATNDEALQDIFRIKGRPSFNPLILHLAGVEQVPQVAREFPEAARQLAEAFWPGPLTLILPRTHAVPDRVTAGKDTVAIRVPDHPLTLALLRAFQKPVAAPSANPFGQVSPTNAVHVAHYFSEQIPFILDGGPCRSGVESTIVGFGEGEIILYRYGAISPEQIAQVTGIPVRVMNKEEKAPVAPGMLGRHYSPRTPLMLTAEPEQALQAQAGKRIGVLLLQNRPDIDTEVFRIVLSPAGNLDEAASGLYAALHQLDQENLDLIIAERMPDEGIGRAMNDRLARAAMG